ncbi:MAG: helix-turn-helix domain-containing protein [Chloroflexi bacterium]|nr:helix-turn-helix domain-containing protein [Chloroflexota bacterium]
MAHRNARLTPAAPKRWSRGSRRAGPGFEAVRRFRVSRGTVTKWVRRYREEGMAGLGERSSALALQPQAHITGGRSAHLRRAPHEGSGPRHIAPPHGPGLVLGSVPAVHGDRHRLQRRPRLTRPGRRGAFPRRRRPRRALGRRCSRTRAPRGCRARTRRPRARRGR